NQLCRWLYRIGLNPIKLNEIQKIVEEHKNEIIKAWQGHFSKR
ncbi:MAG: DUF4160 domain-containing protein, partial [Calditrichaeota bacterium]